MDRPVDGLRQLIADLRQLKAMGIRTDLLLNGNCYCEDCGYCQMVYEKILVEG